MAQNDTIILNDMVPTGSPASVEVSYASVERLMGQAGQAMAMGNCITAEQKALAAMGVLAALPIDMRKEGHASGSLRYSEVMIDAFLGRVREMVQRKARGGRRGNLGIQVSRVRFSSGRNCAGSEGD